MNKVDTNVAASLILIKGIWFWRCKAPYRLSALFSNRIAEPLHWLSCEQTHLKRECEVRSLCITTTTHLKFIHSVWIIKTAQTQSEQLHPSTAPRVVVAQHVSKRGERSCGLSMWTSVVRMALNLQLPVCLSLCFCVSLSLPSTWTFLSSGSCLTVMLLFFYHTASVYVSFFSFTFRNLSLSLLKTDTQVY